MQLKYPQANSSFESKYKTINVFWRLIKNPEKDNDLNSQRSTLQELSLIQNGLIPLLISWTFFAR